MKHILVALFLLATAFKATAADGKLEYNSGIEQNRLIELYTSEGCSSCPPAEAWLNSQRGRSDLWHDRIPVAFHVDYWNYLGWKDRFSSAAYSTRQRNYAQHWRARTVYTPEFFVNGQEWRRWSGSVMPGNEANKVGNLKVELQGRTLTASFQPESDLPNQLVLNIALLGMDRTTRIADGEREGEDTVHQFVVLGHKMIKSDNRHWQTRLPSPQPDEAGNQALAVWVTRNDDPLPLQATGGLIKP